MSMGGGAAGGTCTSCFLECPMVGGRPPCTEGELAKTSAVAMEVSARKARRGRRHGPHVPDAPSPIICIDQAAADGLRNAGEQLALDIRCGA